jgi:hypothetical protein
MDGMHRVVRALLEGQTTIRAVQFQIQPERTTATVGPKTCRTRRIDSSWRVSLSRLTGGEQQRW